MDIRKKVLILDDEAMIGRLVSCFLEVNGYESEYFSSPLDALSSLTSSTDDYFLIFSDYHMSGLNGDQLAKRVRKEGIDIPIVLMTGDLVRQGDLEDGLIDAILMKPVDLDELGDVVQRYAKEALQAV